jgi:hypothetical protein
MWKRVVTLSLVVVTILSFTACNGGDEDVSELPSAQEIIDGVLEAQDDIKSYQYDLSMTIGMSGEVDGEAADMAMDMGFSGVMDIENEEGGAEISLSMTATGEDDVEMAMAMYIVDDMAYVMMDIASMMGGMIGEDMEAGPMWMKQPVSEGEWEEMAGMLSMTGSHLELLELADVADISVTGSERVEGVDCYVLEIIPSLDQLWQTAMQQMAITDMQMPDVTAEILEEAFTEFSVKQWVTKGTYYLTKSEMVMSMEMTPELMELMGEEGMATMDIVVTFLIYDHNQPVSINLPPEALEATGWPE